MRVTKTHSLSIPFLLNRSMPETIQKPFAADDQELEGFLGGNVDRVANGYRIIASIT